MKKLESVQALLFDFFCAFMIVSVLFGLLQAELSAIISGAISIIFGVLSLTCYLVRDVVRQQNGPEHEDKVITAQDVFDKVEKGV